MSFLKKLSGTIDQKEILSVIESRKDFWEKGYGPEYREILDSLPNIKAEMKIEGGVVKLQHEDAPKLEEILLKLKSWRKGPLKVFDTEIETEWRSDYKWDRVKESLPSLKGLDILDIGANNGYFMFRMLEHDPNFVLGIEPTLLYKTQFELLNHFVGSDKLEMQTFGVEHLSSFKNCFDVIFSMGILYHHRSPLQQLFDMRMAMKSGGTLILETIGIPGDEAFAITPEDRYAGMRNIWLLPTLSMLKLWLEKSKFTDVEVLSTNWEEQAEQRATPWSSEVSYKDFINKEDPSFTIEGLPAPKRFLLKASKK